MSGSLADALYLASTWVVPVLLAVTLHEAAHALAARRLGDDTAAELGRVTLNPFKHVDPLGTILIPALLIVTRAPVLFGWAKPVPVRFGRLRRPRRDGIVVAAAGPAANLIIALGAALSIALLPAAALGGGTWLGANLGNAILLNVMLAVFNLLPLPPLDGGRIMMLALPSAIAARFRGLERYGIVILAGLLFLVPFVSAEIGARVDPLADVLIPPVRALLDMFRWIAGA